MSKKTNNRQVKDLMRQFFYLIVFIPFIVQAQEHTDQFPLEHAVKQPGLIGHIHSGWESHYFSEGRDSLNGDGLWANSVELGWNSLAGQIWYASSPQQDYDELQLILALTHSFGQLETYILYKRLEFPTDNAHDTEISTGLRWPGLPFELELTADATYAFNASGSFFELGAHRHFLVNERFNVKTSGILGVNEGFVSDGHDGANHFMLFAESEYAVTESFALTSYTAYSWALKTEATLAGDEQLDDFFHGGFGVRWSF